MMKRTFILAEIVLAAVLGCSILAWISDGVPTWLAKLSGRSATVEPLDGYAVIPLDWSAAGRALDISEAGHVAGTAADEDGHLLAAVWKDGETTFCHGGEGGLLGQAVAVNSSGTVAYNVSPREGSDAWSYVRSPGAGPVCLSDVLPAARGCTINAMNESGAVVGIFQVPGDAPRGFVWSPRSGIHLLEGAGGLPMDISDAGVIVGLDRALVPGGIARTWTPLADGGYGSPLQLQPLFTVEGRAFAVNNLGVAVGRLNGAEPVRWDATSGLQMLPGLEGQAAGWARDINDHGDIVGCIVSRAGGAAVIWRNGSAHDLNRYTRLGGHRQLTEATAINNRGLITCQAVSEEGAEVVLLEPMTSTPTRTSRQRIADAGAAAR